MPRVLALMPPIPVIIVTANTDVSLAQEALKLGACDDVTTPCDFDDPEIAVRTALLAVDEPETRRDGQRFLDTVLDAVGQMSDRSRMSMRERLHLRELKLVLRVATELGDLPLSATLAVEAARAHTSKSVSDPPTP